MATGQPPADNQPAGPAVDSAGRTVVDPSENVRALTEAAARRLDDLRTVEVRCLHVEMDLRAAHEQQLREVVEGYQEKLSLAESKRIDAIRAVDVGAVNRAAEVAATQALTLATQVASSADALRLQVAATATAFDAKLGTALEPINKNVSELQRALYETQGKGLQVSEGRSSISTMGVIIGGLVGLFVLLLTFVGLGLSLYLAFR